MNHFEHRTPGALAQGRAASFGKRQSASAPTPARAAPLPPKPAIVVEMAEPHGNMLSPMLARIPLFTLVVCGTLAFKFNTELRAATDYRAPASPGHFSLLALGASDRETVLGHGEWWRLFTSPALHGSPSHLGGNLVALLVTGLLLEPMVGAGWFAAIYMCGALSGALMSMALNPPGLLGVGASGAIMSTLAALFVLSFHAGARRPRLMRRVAGFLLFPALMPAVSHGARVDINAHFGGVVAGTALAFVMLAAWPEEKPMPPGRSIAAAAAGLLVVCTIWAFLQTGGKYEAYAGPGLDFLPPGEMPRGRDAMEADSYALAEKYQADPRSHMFRGLYFLSHGDLSDAEPHLRDAMRLHQDVMSPRFRALTRAVLALDLAGMGRRDEAAPLAAAVCGDAALDPEMLDSLQRVALCPH